MDTTYHAYFRDKALIFTSDAPSAESHFVCVEPGDDISPAKLLKKTGNNNTLYIISGDPTLTFIAFSSQFRSVEAAGGVVENQDGKVLMIKQRGCWDLPKGHVEEGESHAQAALREVAEETGLEAVEIGDLIAVTNHFYDVYGEWEMKRTWWYGMTCRGGKPPVPQVEEQITEVRWLSGEELRGALRNTYPAVRAVFDARMIDTRTKETRLIDNDLSIK